ERCDILAYEGAPFDVILAHSFLNQFPPAGKRALLAGWRRLLRPGGHVLTSTRLRPGFDPSVRRVRSPSEIAAFVDKARVAAQAQGYAPQALRTLLPRVQTFAERQGGWSLTDTHALRALFSEAGFAVVDLRSGAVAGDRAAFGTADAVSTRVQVVAKAV
ncbi:MAG: class I SAM-dependent methyltransferase, partial [Pseudomonadota bacterium]